MSYTKQNWNNGDVITAEKLNHIEDGIDLIDTGVKFALIECDINWKPLVTLGTIRTIINADMIPYGRYVYDGGQITWFPCESFLDNGIDSPAIIDINTSRFQSTSGSDDATWEVYD